MIQTDGIQTIANAPPRPRRPIVGGTRPPETCPHPDKRLTSHVCDPLAPDNGALLRRVNGEQWKSIDGTWWRPCSFPVYEAQGYAARDAARGPNFDPFAWMWRPTLASVTDGAYCYPEADEAQGYADYATWPDPEGRARGDYDEW